MEPRPSRNTDSSGAGGEHRGALDRLELPPRTTREVSQREFADANPDQPERRMSDRRRHPPDLTVLAFDQFKGNPAIGDALPEPNRRIPGGTIGWGSRIETIAGSVE